MSLKYFSNNFKFRAKGIFMNASNILCFLKCYYFYDANLFFINVVIFEVGLQGKNYFQIFKNPNTDN